MNQQLTTYRPNNRNDWRNWLQTNYRTEKRIWLVFDRKPAPENISYEDAVREALCFGWIDSTVRTLSDEHRAQQFTPRNPKSGWSEPNRERARQLLKVGLMTEAGRKLLPADIDVPFVIPQDILDALRNDSPTTWNNFLAFSEDYRRIRTAYVDDARSEPKMFEMRLANLIIKTRAGKHFGLWK